ncbi:hypothetical protein CVIRNUC_005400 [Coccomyxa viridis]|uniref:Nuclear pore complex protein NUP96 C-terminal domain-containing protein n=1 Tax=Coccomyxa viridis TaxID=1274662 RepID=A0AAV1I5C8_9CHLO|nr:hypothetical protein CVIRNUC_005400 [Coccomyxa viridis]
MQLSDEDEEVMDSQQGRGRDLFDAAMGTPEPEDDHNLANSPVMHVALSARLGLDPAELAQYRSDMFPSGGAQRQAEPPAGTLVTRSATPPQEDTPRTAALVDAGLMAGHSFRVGWAPGGRFAHPGAKGSTARHGAAPIALQQTPFGEGVLPEGISLSSKAGTEAAARLRERCKAMLQIHMQHSSPSKAAAGGRLSGSAAATTRRWAMQCSRSTELQAVVTQLQEALKEHCTKQDEAEQDDELMNASIPAFCAEPEGLPAAAIRRSRLSAWLRSQASDKVEAALKKPASDLQHLAQLLSSQRLSAAVSLASASGDVRLAMLICQAASRSSAREEAERQLALWQDAGFAGHMDEARMLVYELLAGHVDHVIPQMQLDWRRALALHLWYGESPAAPLLASLEAYERAIGEGAAPSPLPLYMERQPSLQLSSSLAAAPIDVDYRLMELAAGGPSRADGAFLATLLSPLAFTPDPLDYLFPWMLLQALQAIAAIPEATSLDEVCAVHMSLISQLERLGGLEEWALYVALHLPDGSEEGCARDALLLELLHRHAPVWAASQAKQDFITRALGLPAAWLASALATLAAHRDDPEEEYEQRIAAGDWEAAHALFTERLAPRWWAAGQHDRLLLQLQPLLQAGQEAQAQVDSLQWQTGAELYETFVALEDMYKSRSYLDDNESTRGRRMETVTYLSSLLQKTGDLLDAAGGEQRQLYRQEVYSSMSQKLADWLLTDGQHSPEDVAQRQQMSTELHWLPEASRMHHIQIAAAALGEILA